MAEDRVSVEEAVARLDAYRREFEIASRNLTLLQGVWNDTTRARQTLESWSTEKKGAEVLVPIGAGTFVRASLADSEYVLVGLGAGYSAERPSKEAIELLQKREEELSNEINRMAQAAASLEAEAQSLEAAIEDAMAAVRGASQGKPSPTKPPRKGYS